MADVAMYCKSRDDIHESWDQVLRPVLELNLRLSFHYIIYACERTTDVFIVPIAFTADFSDVKHEKMHFVYVVVHKFV